MQNNLSYQIIGDNIHWIQLHNNTRQTVDDIFVIIDKVAKSTPKDETILYLLDSGEVPDLPFRYLMQRVEIWESEQEFIPATKNAIIQSQSFIMGFMLNMMMRVFSKDNNDAQVFVPEDREKALAWLKEPS